MVYINGTQVCHMVQKGEGRPYQRIEITGTGPQNKEPFNMDYRTGLCKTSTTSFIVQHGKSKVCLRPSQAQICPKQGLSSGKTPNPISPAVSAGSSSTIITLNRNALITLPKYSSIRVTVLQKKYRSYNCNL